MSRLLLDTHVIIWLGAHPERIPERMAKMIRDEANELIFSSVSIWEIAIKRALGRPDFQVDPAAARRGLLDKDVTEIAFESHHAIAAGNLPPHHNDPFDRALLGQALADGLSLLTSDKVIRRYAKLVTLA